MASITSVISLFVLLLATYCHSVPIVQRYSSSTPNYETTTIMDKSKFDRDNTMKLVHDEESTTVSDIHKPRPSGEHYMAESTTVGDLKHGKDVTRLSRGSEDLLHSSSPMTSTFEYSSSPMTSTFKYSSSPKHVEDEVRAPRGTEELLESSSPMTSTFEYSSSPMTSTFEYSSSPKHVEDESRSPRETEEILESSSPMTSTDVLPGFPSTTMESSTHFDRRAIRPAKMESERESTTRVSENVRPSWESTTMGSMDESTTEPSSSVASFGKMTGLLDGERSEEKSSSPAYEKDDHTTEKSSSPAYEKDDHTTEEPTTRSPVKPGRYTNVITVIPGKVIDKQIYNVPANTYVAKERFPSGRRPLPEGKGEPVIEKRGWDI